MVWEVWKYGHGGLTHYTVILPGRANKTKTAPRHAKQDRATEATNINNPKKFKFSIYEEEKDDDDDDRLH